MQNTDQDKNAKEIILVYELFDKIPLFSITTDYESVYYKIFGISIWKTLEIKDVCTRKFKKRYYLLCLPILEIEDGLDDD